MTDEEGFYFKRFDRTHKAEIAYFSC